MKEQPRSPWQSVRFLRRLCAIEAAALLCLCLAFILHTNAPPRRTLPFPACPSSMPGPT